MFNKYDAYKDSGMEWMGDIPSHWVRKKIKSIANIYSGDSLSPEMKAKFSISTDCSNPYVSSKDINVDTSKLNYETGLSIPSSFSKYKLAPKNSVLLCIEGGSAGRKIAFTETEVNFVNKLACFYSVKISNKFIFYYLKSQPFQVQFKLALSGLIGGVSLSSLENFEIYQPLKTEQDQIVAFLDKKITELDQAIAIKEQQIALLNERKQIVIQKAVTQGLNPNVAMKDSGVEWIGQIPEHWEIIRSKYLFTQRKENSKKDDVQLSATQAYGVITQEEYERRTGKSVVKISLHLDKRKRVHLDDFVISMRSFQGGLERAWAEGCIRSSYVVLKPLKPIDPDYFAYLFKTPMYIKALQNTSNFIRDGQDLNFGNFSQVDLFIIPLSEQKQIVEYIKRQLGDFENHLELLNQQIEKLKEYKTTLINDAVTGKIKVA